MLQSETRPARQFAPWTVPCPNCTVSLPVTFPKVCCDYCGHVFCIGGTPAQVTILGGNDGARHDSEEARATAESTSGGA